MRSDRLDIRPPRRSLVSRLTGRLEPGAVIRGIGRYRILSVIGEGGMGKVFLAEKQGAHRFSKLMAIKAIPKSKNIDASMFFDEARLTANLIHPNIVQVYQLGETRREHFIVMEHVFGITLLAFIERHEALGRAVPVEWGLFIVDRILSALHYAHNKRSRDGVHFGIVHRDICPNNILISFRGVPKLLDFGVAKAKILRFQDEAKVVFGKYPYMAPEQVRREGTEPRSDLYSLGLVMYELFTGRLVHEATDTKMLLDDLDRTVTPPHEVNEAIDPDLSAIIMRAMAHDVEKRFPTAKAMRLACDEYRHARGLFPDQDAFADYLTTLFPQAARHRWW